MVAAVSRLRTMMRFGVHGLRTSWVRPMGTAARASMDVEGWREREQGPSVPVEVVHSQEVDRGVQWVFLGCPGVGKGTYASRLAKLLHVPHIAMGDLVRREILNLTPMAEQLKKIMGAGQLLPDEIIFRLLTKRLENGASEGETGFILDGFPRTVHQAEIMDEVASIDLVVNLKLREDVLISKCLGRRICSECGGNFNVASIDVDGYDSVPRILMPPLLPPPKCASKMTIRADDTEDVVRARLRIYYEESQPVEDYYRAKGLLLNFDVAGGIPETWPRLLSALNLEDKISGSHDSRKMMA
ncbi:probable adenylate kinase 6, chloroplastic [Physcomitrium patens]|uniref:adenylate kinase n=1 Tax=Physcomitrium patens TaxID=3218 RepID=A0A2K1IRA2_PHYPA|nr:probable adenylate kinase 6, chloroplastic [Physcomitrium patens]PNR31806.1 hypothetical protein PHYPA_025929 [Physcomitrium patens]|eukprot:XP_024359483.1 probable adenylate kinase 6, chloroplastic [Physcomitrella patens]